MITYNSLDLFSSGPGLVFPGTIEGRDAVTNSPGAIGATVITQGLLPRKLIQRGQLVADDAEALQALIDSIQTQVNAGTCTLIDQNGKAWPDCLLQRFEHSAFTRLGPRYTVAYEITYLQTHP